MSFNNSRQRSYERRMNKYSVNSNKKKEKIFKQVNKLLTNKQIDKCVDYFQKNMEHLNPIYLKELFNQIISEIIKYDPFEAGEFKMINKKVWDSFNFNEKRMLMYELTKNYYLIYRKPVYYYGEHSLKNIHTHFKMRKNKLKKYLNNMQLDYIENKIIEKGVHNLKKFFNKNYKNDDSNV